MAKDRKDYNDMTREELVAIIGIEDNPNYTRVELIDMARDRDTSM